MTGLIHYVMMTELYPTMEKVIDLFYKLKIEEDGRGISTSLDSQFAILNRKDPESIAARKLRSFCQLPFTTGSCVRDDLEKAIQNMFPASIQSAMSEDAYVSFEDFATERTAIFIITSPVRTAQYAFANLMFSLAIRRLTEFAETQENSRLPRNVKLFFDDFSCGFPIMNYEKSSRHSERQESAGARSSAGRHPELPPGRCLRNSPAESGTRTARRARRPAGSAPCRPA